MFRTWHEGGDEYKIIAFLKLWRFENTKLYFIYDTQIALRNFSRSNKSHFLERTGHYLYNNNHKDDNKIGDENNVTMCVMLIALLILIL